MTELVTKTGLICEKCGRLVWFVTKRDLTKEHFICHSCKKPITDTQEIMQSYIDALNEAVTLLKQCVNYDDKDMTTAISGELADKIKEFIERCGV